MFQVLAFINYWLQQADEHSLHSPFVYKLYRELIKPCRSFRINSVEQLRQQLLNNHKYIQLTDFGAGSRVSSSKQRTVSSLAKHASTPPKFSALLHALIGQFNMTQVLEFGTSLGLNSLYMSTKPEVHLTTFEGDPILCHMARSHFDQFNRPNIELIEGPIDETLPLALHRLPKIDMAYLDANHRYAPTLHYYESVLAACHHKSIIVIDDIHWSKEMSHAWDTIRKKDEIFVSIDLFEAGLLFLDPGLTRGHYILHF
ncbi:class I SAM-dependent methyltransferase [Roseivirga sp. UBA1976]|uniref:O-methyltransferase n=1 Tax=Roseivirga sp. UBA1976 TaxID=1947386 RepID=UPI00257AB1B9|nr:class I SAM-dependent methyltransferase [Roseivirga sp. UBA1976]